MSLSYRVKLLFDYELLKLKDHSWSTLSGIFTAYLFYVVLPKLIKIVWPRFLSIISNQLYVRLFIFITHVSFHLIANIFYYIIYQLEWSFLEKYKVTSKPWPWELDSKAWRAQFHRSLKQVILHNFIIFPTLTLSSTFFYDPKFRIDVESYPEAMEIIVQTFFLMLVDDFYNFWVHRIFHVFPLLYNKIHKKHHEFIIPVSISAEYAHSIEYMALNIPAPFMGVLILGNKCHYATVLLFVALKSIEPVEVHSGYEFPWSPFKFIPFGTPTGWHDYHHTHNVGNYSSFFTFWDILLANDLSFVENIRENYKRRAIESDSKAKVKKVK